MVDVAEIDSGVSLEAWLTETGQSQEACVWIAHRAAMRILPVYWQWVATSELARERDLPALTVLRASLISGVAAIASTPEISAAADVAAYAAARAAADAANANAAYAAYAAEAAAYAAADVAAYAAARAANAADAARAAADADAAYAALRADCKTLETTKGIVPRQGPRLWHGQDNPLGDFWTKVKDSVDANDWRFWLGWYQHALDGTETRQDLLTRIALSDLTKPSIEPNDYDPFWEGTDAEVNARIEAVVEDWKAKQTNTPDINPPTTEQQNAITPMIRLRRISVSDARDLLDRDATLISEKCQMVVEEADSALAYHNLRIPNDPEELSAHNQITAALQLAKVLAMDLHGVVPEPDTPVSEDDASRLRRILKGLEAQLKEVSCYIDDEAHPKTYGRAVKLTSATLVGGLVSIVPGLNAAVAIPAVYACLFGSDSVKAVTALFKSDG